MLVIPIWLMNLRQVVAIESDDSKVVNISQPFMTTWSASLEGKREEQ